MFVWRNFAHAIAVNGFPNHRVYCRRLLICDRYAGRRADEIRKTARRLQRPGGLLAPIWITKEAGIFKKHGLDVELLFIPGGPTAAAALLSGEVPISVVGGPAIVSSNLAGSDLVMIAGIVNTFAFQIVTVKPITSYQQLKGKRLGVNRFGASPDVAARFALKAHGYRSQGDNHLAIGRTIDTSHGYDVGATRSGCVPTPDHNHGPEAGHERAFGSR